MYAFCDNDKTQYRYFSDFFRNTYKSREFLSRRLECQYGLMDLLMSKHVLLDYQLSKLKALQSNFIEQNDNLIEMLCLQEDVQPYADFLSALTETSQSHLAKYITHNKGIARFLPYLACYSILTFRILKLPYFLKFSDICLFGNQHSLMYRLSI